MHSPNKKKCDFSLWTKRTRLSWVEIMHTMGTMYLKQTIADSLGLELGSQIFGQLLLNRANAQKKCRTNFYNMLSNELANGYNSVSWFQTFTGKDHGIRRAIEQDRESREKNRWKRVRREGERQRPRQRRKKKQWTNEKSAMNWSPMFENQWEHCLKLLSIRNLTRMQCVSTAWNECSFLNLSIDYG